MKWSWPKNKLRMLKSEALWLLVVTEATKIRTYNYSQSRVTDHRINLTLYDLDNIINGDIEKIISELKLVDNTEKLKNISDDL